MLKTGLQANERITRTMNIIEIIPRSPNVALVTENDAHKKIHLEGPLPTARTSSTVLHTTKNAKLPIVSLVKDDGIEAYQNRANGAERNSHRHPLTKRNSVPGLFQEGYGQGVL
ncbi:unnamed protein product [Phytophthora lilii]|uniref:Unnamed protein product n=1 Tax=Phytophthora lilii TaxID=2077276 RepID=A0A9W6WS37_9STRA|nr:unnamed protein product [Phytophthora lilii]